MAPGWVPILVPWWVPVLVPVWLSVSYLWMRSRVQMGKDWAWPGRMVRVRVYA